MGTFLLILFIMFVVVPLLRGAWAIYKLRRQARSVFEAMHRDNASERRRREAENRPAGWQQAEGRRKIISKNEGEYVEWEEVEMTSETTTAFSDSAQSQRRPRTVDEQRIVDVEWEDVKPSK